MAEYIRTGSLFAEKEAKQKSYVSVLDAYFDKMFKAAKKAAQKAADECVPNPVAFQANSNLLEDVFDESKPYDVCLDGQCGGAYLRVIGPSKNMLVKELKKKGLISGDYYMGYSLSVDYDSKGSQSADRAEAAANAYSKVIRKYGIPNQVVTYLT